MALQVFTGDCRDVLPTLTPGSVQTCVTSPPYWNLRDYKVEPSVWDGDPACEHLWQDQPFVRNNDQTAGPKQRTNAGSVGRDTPVTSAFCSLCGAWRGALGLEPTPELYIQHLVLIFRLVRDVLRDDSTLWINIGDSFVNNPSTSQIPRAEQGNGSGAYQIPPQKHADARRQTANRAQPLIDAGYKKKDLVGIPWMLAFALRADGWYLRSDVIWQKPACMPESVLDRPTRSHEYVFLLSKSPHYFYDHVAIAEPTVKGAAGSTFTKGKTGVNGAGRVSQKPRVDGPTRNARSVWTLTAGNFKGAHYAVMPQALAERCILAGSSPRACEICNAPWERVIERTTQAHPPQPQDHLPMEGQRANGTRGNRLANVGQYMGEATTTGWQPTCACDATGSGKSIVLDPFLGSGTVARVSIQHGRDCIGIELKPEHIALVHERTNGIQMSLLTEASASASVAQSAYATADTDM